MYEIDLTPSQMRAKLESPELIRNIIAEVANGKTLIEASKEYNVHYGFLIERINKDDDTAQALRDAFFARKEYTKELLLQELQDLAKFNIAEMYDDDMNVKHIKEMPSYMQKCIKGVEVKADGSVKIQFIDKLKAIEVLAKTTDMLVQRVEVTADETLENIIGRTFKNDD